MSIQRVLIGLHAAALFIAVSNLFMRGPVTSMNMTGDIIELVDGYAVNMAVYRLGFAVTSLLSGLGAMVCAPPNKESYVLAVTTVLSFIFFCL